MMYRETLNPIYLEQARKIGNFLVSHPRLPEDKVPYWDYDDPQIPNANVTHQLLLSWHQHLLN